MKKMLIVLMAILLGACTVTEQVVVVITATSPPETETPPPPTNTNTPIPTNTPNPTPTPKPSWNPVAIGEIEGALRDAGYRRYPFTNEDGVSGFEWVKESGYESVTTWEDHSFELQVLHDTSPSVRLEHMEKKFKVLDRVLPSGFMAQLRQENEAYNRSVHTNLSGEPDQKFAYGGEWQTIWAQYYTEYTDIGGYDIWFSVWWWQSTCPPQYWSCYYPDFPGLEFSGDSSFSFYSIYIEPIDAEPLSNQSS